MSETQDPVVQRFSQHEVRIKELKKSHGEFSSACRDYAEIVDEIEKLDQSIGSNAKALADLHELQLGLEHDLLDWLNDTTNSSTTSE